MLAVPPAGSLGATGLILPTFVQDTVPAWAAPYGPTTSPDAPRDDPLDDLARLCAGAEALGAGALWACDHLFWEGPCLECVVTLTVAATATDRLILGTCVVQLPLRGATEVAKQAATLQSLSRGRFVLGVGVGSHPGEYDQVGVDYHTRGRQLDLAIAELRRSWRSGEGAGSGEGSGSRYRQLPVPPPVPVWVGGSSEAALRRAATLADGWMPLFLTASEYGGAVERLAKEVDRAGRARGSVTPAMVLFVSVDDDPLTALRRGSHWMSSLYGIPARAFERHLVAGTASDVARAVTDYRRAGADHVAVYVTADQPLDQFERLSAALPAGRAATRR